MGFRSSLIAALSLSLVWAFLLAAPWRAEAAALSQADQRLYDRAFQRAGQKAFGEARTLAGGGSQALLAEFFQWLELTRGEQEGDFGELSAFLRANPDWPRIDRIRARAEKSLPEDMSPAQVVAWFGGREALTAAGAMRLAEALPAPAGQDPGHDPGHDFSHEAEHLLRDAWASARFTSGEEKAFLKRYGKILRPGDHMARLETLLGRRQIAASRRQARRIGGGTRELAEARLRLSLNRPGVDGAIGRVPAELRSDPGLMYERARWRRRRGRTDGVVEMIDAAAGTVRQAERWWRLRHWAARRTLRDGAFAVAYRMAAGHGLERGAGFAEGEWLAGWIALSFLNEPRRAYRHFTRLYDGVATPISLSRGAYWAGAAKAAHGEMESARRWYRLAAKHGTAFYGQLASARTGEPLRVDFKAAATPTAEDRAAFEGRKLVRLTRLLGELDQRKHQDTFLHRLRGRAETALEHRLVADLANALGRPDHALRTAKQARRQGILDVADLFPMPAGLRETVTATAKPEAALVLAVIRQESAFDSQAVSRAGARGLMQLMPATAKQVAGELRVPYRRRELTADPAANLRLGRAYLEGLLRSFGGSDILALAAYNAGPRRVASWIRELGDPRHPDVDPVDWIESIPFNETRNYVQRVLEGRTVYRLALTGQRTVMPLKLAASEVAEAP